MALQAAAASPEPRHPTAVVEAGAELHPSVRLAPYAVIGPRVRLAAGCVIGPHAVVLGDTWLGEGCVVGPHAVIGAPPQVREESGEGGALRVGAGTIIRELATVHAARAGGETRVGARCLLMAGSHVAHDCRLGDGVELANGVQLAGHVQVGEAAGLGGLAAVHQFARIGAYAFVAAAAGVSQDVPPFALAAGDRARVYGINTVGLRRRGFAPTLRRELARALRLLLGAATLADGLRAAREAVPPSPELEALLAFAAFSRRGLCARAGRRRQREAP